MDAVRRHRHPKILCLQIEKVRKSSQNSKMFSWKKKKKKKKKNSVFFK